MSSCICLESSVLVKVLVEKEDSDRATLLFDRIIQHNQLIVLPAYAWAEIGTVLRRKMRIGQLTVQEANELWLEFRNFPGIEYLNDEAVLDLAWGLSQELHMPTLYDAAFLAVAEVIQRKTGEICEFWTADEKLVNLTKGRKIM